MGFRQIEELLFLERAVAYLPGTSLGTLDDQAAVDVLFAGQASELFRAYRGFEIGKSIAYHAGLFLPGLADECCAVKTL